MHQAAIVAVGTELLFGTTINTNAGYISQRLHEIGIGVLAHLVTGDNPRRLKRTLEVAFEEADIVIVTGGLGPTQDDLTKEAIAEFMDTGLVFDEEAKRRLDEMMSRIGNQQYTPNNIKQIYLPEGCTPFYNNAGSAPGFALERDRRLVIALPGPPREMTQMMTESVIPYLMGRSGKIIHSQTLHFYRIGESALETALLPIIDGQTDPTVATYAKEGECAVRISSMRQTTAEAEAAVKEMVERAKELAGEYLFSEHDQSYPEVIVEKLRESGMRLAAAEACTAGMFANAILSAAGSSEVFDRSFVLCNDEAMVELLDVPTSLLVEQGSVSLECCKALALGALSKSHADIAVAVLGDVVPEPTGGERPQCGIIYGVALRGSDGDEPRVEVYERPHLSRGRQVNCRICILELCYLIDRKLRKTP